MNQYWSAIQPVLVSDSTSTGHPYLPVLVTTRSSTGHDADQYWFVSLSLEATLPPA